MEAGDWPEQARELSALFEQQWGPLDEPAEAADTPGVPQNLLALNGAGDLCGGLAFSRFAHPDNGEPALWINALLVRPEYRRQGIASELVAAACVTAKFHAQEVFVLTAYPVLYEKLGWVVVKRADESLVLRVKL